MRLLEPLKRMFSRNTVKAEKYTWWKEYPRLISPTDFKEVEVIDGSTKEVRDGYLQIDFRTFVKCLRVGTPLEDVEGYPRDMNDFAMNRIYEINPDGWNYLDSNVIMPINPVKSQELLQRALNHNRENQAESKLLNKSTDREGTVDMKLQFDYTDIVSNYQLLHNKSLKMYNSSNIIIIAAESLEKLDEAISIITSILDSERILWDVPVYRQKETFLSAMPFPFSAEFTQVQVFSNHAADLCAVTDPYGTIDNSGLLYGFCPGTGKDVLINLSKLSSQHMLILGPTGSGKTFTTLTLLMRAHDLLGKRIIYTTPKADVGTNYRAVADYYGEASTVVDIGPKGACLNPLQIMFDAEGMGADMWAYMAAYDDHKQLLIRFFQVWVGNEFSANMESYLDESLNKVYGNAGILRNDGSTWTRPFPVISDLRAIWEIDSKDQSQGTKQRTAEALLNKTYHVSREGSLGYLNTQTNIDLSKDFIIVDMSGVPDIIQDAMNVLVTGIFGARFKTDQKKETIIAVDEGAVYLRNPQLSLFLLKTLTQGRSFGISLWLATQQAADLKKAGLNDEFKTNMTLNIVLGENMKKDSIGLVSDYFHLSKESVNALLSSGVGEGLLVVQDTPTHVKFECTEMERDVIKGVYGKGVSDAQAGEIKAELLAISSQNGIAFENWAQGDARVLSRIGYIQRTAQSATEAGKVKLWIDPEILDGDKVGNQSFDHYSTVMQIAGHLILKGFSEVQVNHYEGADITAKIRNTSICIEYEKPGSHSKPELIAKKARWEKQYQKVLFVGNSSNERLLSDAVGEENVFRRGSAFASAIEDILNPEA